MYTRPWTTIAPIHLTGARPAAGPDGGGSSNASQAMTTPMGQLWSLSLLLAHPLDEEISSGAATGAARPSPRRPNSSSYGAVKSPG